MLVARDLEVRAGARLLLEHASFQVGRGDKIGLVGRNGAGKTTLTRILSGEAQPAAGLISRTGTVGYLPQDPRTGDLDLLAKNRILSARGLDAVVGRLRRAELGMGDDSEAVRDKAMAAYARAEAELAAAGGYAAEAEAARIASNLGLPERVLHQPLGTLSGGQRRRVELARILFSGAETLLLDEPTNHLDADRSTGWSFQPTGGLLVISHDVGPPIKCEQGVSSRCEYRRAGCLRAGLKRYPAAETDEKRRRCERLNAGRKADQLLGQRIGAWAKPRRSQRRILRRACERLLVG
jgi:ATPase subunit of ABC transporter with duplicated ATPase domains